MRSWTSWQDWSGLVLGIWLFISPWLIGFGSAAAAWNAWILGVAVAVVAVWVLAVPRHVLGEVVLGLAGVWLFVAPWLFGFSSLAVQAWDVWLVGILLVVLPIWRYASRSVAY